MKRTLIIPFFFFLLLGLFINLNAQTTSSCLEIQSILVDACQPPPIAGSSQEYRNEMLRFLVGPNPLNISNMDMDFGYGQFFQGIRIPDAVTAAKTAELNATIQSCGQLIEPVGGVLPPNAKVIWISSYLVSATTNSFASLGETVYVIYHNSTFSFDAYFINYALSGTTLAPDNIVITISFGGACSDVVSYFRPSLIMQNGMVGAGDGARVNFTFSGVPSYVNNGCFAPYMPFSAAWTNPNTICDTAPPFNLLTTITGTPGGTFSGAGVDNNVFDPSGLSGLVFISYSVISGFCQVFLTQLIQVNSSLSASWTIPSAPICQGSIVALNPLLTGGIGGTWSGAGVVGSTFNSTGLSGNIPITYSIGSGSCQSFSTQNIQVISSGNSSWIPPTNLCNNSAALNLNTTVTGTSGGNWTGLGVSTTGVFNPTAITGGSSSITYTAGFGSCQSISTQTISIANVGSAAWNLPAPFCTGGASFNLNALVTGNAGGTWSGTGVSNNGIFLPGLSADSFPITYTVGSGACQSFSTQNIQVISSGNASWNPPNVICADSAPINLALQLTGQAGGSWTGTGVSDAGIFTTTGLSGEVTVIYTVGLGACQAAQAYVLEVSSTPIAPTVTGIFSYCANDEIQTLTAAGIAGSSFSWYSNLALSSLLSNNVSFTPTPSTTSLWVNQTVEGCVSPPIQVILIINPVPSPPLTQAFYTYCEGNLPPLITVTGNGTTYNWYGSALITNPIFTGSSYQATVSGSYQIWVTESLNGCESNPSIIAVTEQELVQASISPTGPISLCTDQTVTLTSSSSFNNLWSTGATTQNILVTTPEIITLTVTGNCNQATDQITILDEQISASFETSVSSGQVPLEVTFSSQSLGSSECNWLISGNPTFNLDSSPYVFEQEGDYVISLVCTSPNGCISSADRIINVTQVDASLYIPNAFTPNNDGINDVFKPIFSNEPYLYQFTIFNRWGEVIFFTTDSNKYWTGNRDENGEFFAPDAIYNWRMSFQSNSDSKRLDTNGHVSIIR